MRQLSTQRLQNRSAGRKGGGGGRKGQIGKGSNKDLRLTGSEVSEMV